VQTHRTGSLSPESSFFRAPPMLGRAGDLFLVFFSECLNPSVNAPLSLVPDFPFCLFFRDAWHYVPTLF